MQPQSPDPQFDFMLKDRPQAKRTLGLPALPKPAKIGLAVAGVLILVIVLASVTSGGEASTGISAVLARGAEIQRVTAEVQQLNLQNSASQAVASTVATGLASDQIQLEHYLKNNNKSVSAAQLAADTDKSTDAQMQSASQSNSLDQTFVAYLQQSLTKYRSDLQAAYNSTGPNGRAILQNSLDGVDALLATAPLKS